jgi:GDPmannose 4,6-dehydratase
VVHDPHLDRPAEVDLLIGDYTKARNKLGWEPKTRMVDLARLMVDHDLRLAAIEAREKEFQKERAKG